MRATLHRLLLSPLVERAVRCQFRLLRKSEFLFRVVLSNTL